MSQDSRFKFDRMLDNDPTQPEAVQTGENYAAIGHARNICFVLADGRKLFLNYSYLVSGEYTPAEGKIVLTFTSHAVSLRGILLETLFDAVMSHIPRIIAWKDARYNAVAEKGQAVVNDIKIEKAE